MLPFRYIPPTCLQLQNRTVIFLFQISCKVRGVSLTIMYMRIRKMGRESVSLRASLISNACYAIHSNHTFHNALPSYKFSTIPTSLLQKPFLCRHSIPRVRYYWKDVSVSSTSCNTVNKVFGSPVSTTHTGAQLRWKHTHHTPIQWVFLVKPNSAAQGSLLIQTLPKLERCSQNGKANKVSN